MLRRGLRSSVQESGKWQAASPTSREILASSRARTLKEPKKSSARRKNPLRDRCVQGTPHVGVRGFHILQAVARTCSAAYRRRKNGKDGDGPTPTSNQRLLESRKRALIHAVSSPISRYRFHGIRQCPSEKKCVLSKRGTRPCVRCAVWTALKPKPLSKRTMVVPPLT
jgi:hypothetical protein